MSKRMSFNVKDKELLGPLDAGRLLGLGPDSIKYFERIGKLRCIRTASGNRLFLRKDLEKLRRLRRLAKESHEIGNEQINQ